MFLCWEVEQIIDESMKMGILFEKMGKQNKHKILNTDHKK